MPKNPLLKTLDIAFFPRTIGEPFAVLCSSAFVASTALRHATLDTGMPKNPAFHQHLHPIITLYLFPYERSENLSLRSVA